MKSLELFSGAGGLAKGLELSGFVHSKFVEFNKDACHTLRLNFSDELVFEGDIAHYDFSELETVDIVSGGPPCQPFSLGGKHKAHNDSRDMFPYAIKAIEKLNPKAFIFENVKGLLRQTFSEYFEYIVCRLSSPDIQQKPQESWQDHLVRLRKKIKPGSTGYKVQYRLLNSADYGVPQVRERVVIVGVRNDIEADWVFPKATHSYDRLLWEQNVSGEYWERHGLPFGGSKDLASRIQRKYGMIPPEGLPWQTVRDCFVEVPDLKTNHGIADHIYKPGAKTYPGHTGSFIDEPSKTIKAGGHGVPGGENMVRYEDGSVRYFTVYEAKLIQSFPKDFQVTGSWGEAMRQIGNAVPVKLAEVLGTALKNTLHKA